jgi:hypothetical protein
VPNGKDDAMDERDDVSSAPESGQPAGGRESYSAEPENPENDWRALGPPPEADGEDF